MLKRVFTGVAGVLVTIAACVLLVGCENNEYAYVGGPGREGFTAPAQGPNIPPEVIIEEVTEPLPWEIEEEQGPYNPYYGGYGRYWYWW